LPIGISKTSVQKVLMPDEHVGDYVGPTCALCHNSQLYYKGKRIRIDGGNNNRFDLQAYTHALDDALQATLKDPAKFDRLASPRSAERQVVKEFVAWLRDEIRQDAATEVGRKGAGRRRSARRQASRSRT
jgi:hypothetical protein